MGSPVARVPDEVQLPPAIEAWRRGRGRSRSAPGPGIVDPVLPDRRRDPADKGMAGQHEREERSLLRVAIAKHDPQRLRVDRLDASHRRRSAGQCHGGASFGLLNARNVKRKSRAVSGCPSLHRACGRIGRRALRTPRHYVDARDQVGRYVRSGPRSNAPGSIADARLEEACGQQRVETRGFLGGGRRRRRCRRASASARLCRPLPRRRAARRRSPLPGLALEPPVLRVPGERAQLCGTTLRIMSP